MAQLGNKEVVALPILDLKYGDIIQHKKGGRYVVEDTNAFFSEELETFGVPPEQSPCIGYRAMYGDRQKWFRPKDMFTEDRFQVVGHIHDNM